MSACMSARLAMASAHEITPAVSVSCAIIDDDKEDDNIDEEDDDEGEIAVEDAGVCTLPASVETVSSRANASSRSAAAAAETSAASPLAALSN